MKRRLVAFSIFFASFVMLTSSAAFAAWDKPCNVKKIVGEQYWCEVCKKVRHAFDECPTVDYIWDFSKHTDKKNPHTELPHAWACEKVSFSCINTECEDYAKCIPHPGSCDTCMDDFTSKGIYARVLFHCSKCNKDWEEPGTGHKTDPKRTYVPIIIDPGTCPDDGTKLESVCTMSGTCPHVSY
ncbi:MAG: hypothetical protein ACUZ8H_13635 [Candidatus Anammoxibacter sp.]